MYCRITCRVEPIKSHPLMFQLPHIAPPFPPPSFTLSCLRYLISPPSPHSPPHVSAPSYRPPSPSLIHPFMSEVPHIAPLPSLTPHVSAPSYRPPSPPSFTLSCLRYLISPPSPHSPPHVSAPSYRPPSLLHPIMSEVPHIAPLPSLTPSCFSSLISPPLPPSLIHPIMSEVPHITPSPHSPPHVSAPSYRSPLALPHSPYHV